MSEHDNIAAVRWFMQVMNSGDASDLERYVAEDWVNHDPSLPPMQGHDGARQLLETFRIAFPDINVEIDDIFADGEKVAFRATFEGTNTGELMGMPPTGKTARVTASGIIRVKDGKVAENWVNFDALGMMQQLGVIPAPGQG